MTTIIMGVIVILVEIEVAAFYVHVMSVGFCK